MKTLTEFTDYQLVREFKNDNTAAFEVLINRYQDKLFSSILFLVKDKNLAEDLFQDSFIRIIDTIRNDGYTEEGKFLPWAIRIAHNLCIDYLGKVKKFNHTENTADKKIAEAENFNQVSKLLDFLPVEQREVIVLRHFADLNFKEISETTNCSINTALGHMHCALKNVREMLAKKEVVF